MVKINYKSDFKINEKSETIALEVPFVFSYYVFDSKKYVVSFDGHNYVNCERKEDGSLDVIFNKPEFGIGHLKVERKYAVDDKAFADGVFDVVTVDKSDVFITSGKTFETYIETLVVPPFLKGDKGDPMTWDTMTETERGELVHDVAEAIDPEMVMTENEKARQEAERSRQTAEQQRSSTFNTLNGKMQSAITAGNTAAGNAQKVVDNYDAKVAEQDSKLTELGSEVNLQTNEIKTFKEAVTNQVNNYKPVEINGDVTNAADEEDLTSDENNLLKLKNRNNLNGMGYVILRNNKTFAEQLTQTNTIYEIRYDFDLNGDDIEIPNGCILRINGGSVINGTLNGDFIIDGTILKKGSEFGEYNAHILKSLKNTSINIDLEGGDYYITPDTPILVSSSINIYNGGITIKGTLFDVNNNSMIEHIKMTNISFNGEGNCHVFKSDNTNCYFIRTMEVIGCSFNNVNTFISKHFSDNEEIFGIENIIFQRNKVESSVHSFLSINDNVYRQFIVSDNYFHNCTGAVVSSVNTLRSAITKNTYVAKFICHNNVLVNDIDVFSANSYNTFVLLKGFEANVYNNYVEGVKSNVLGSQTYSFYLSCDLLDFHGNKIVNCVNVAENSNASFTQDDSRFHNTIFKCKEVISDSSWTIRNIYNNSFVITEEFANSVSANALIGITLTNIAINEHTNGVSVMNIKDNYIDIHATLVGPATIITKNLLCNNNFFSIYNISRLGGSFDSDEVVSIIEPHSSCELCSVVGNILHFKKLKTRRPSYVTIGSNNKSIVYNNITANSPSYANGVSREDEDSMIIAVNEFNNRKVYSL